MYILKQTTHSGVWEGTVFSYSWVWTRLSYPAFSPGMMQTKVKSWTEGALNSAQLHLSYSIILKTAEST